MKRLLYLAVLALSVTGAYAQDANAIMKEYLNKVNVEKHKDQTLRVEMEMEVQGNIVPMTISYAKNQKDMRIDMAMQNNDLSFVIVGESGWLEAGDQCQDLPAEFVAQTRHATVFSIVSDMSGWTFSYLEKVSEADKEYHKIQGTAENQTYTIWVDVTTGLVSYVDTVEQGQKVRICMSDYKEFGDVMIPSVMSIVGMPQMNSSIKISSVTFNVDIPGWYFERP